MASSIFGIGISGLSAAQAGLLTAGHNISNVNTQGYNRQEVVQTPALPQYTGGGFFGRGVDVSEVRRAYDALLEAQSWQAQATASHLDGFSKQINRIDGVLANPEVGLSPALTAFFGSVHDVAANPSDAAARQGMLSQAQALSGRFHQLDNQFEAQRNDVNSSMAAMVGQINSISSQIADLNGQIVRLSSSGTGQQLPNDLLDKRDQLVTNLSKFVQAHVVRQDSGSYNVFLGSGQPLVLKEGASLLKVVVGDEDPHKQQVVLQGAGAAIKMRAADLAGGQLGGLLQFRDDALDPAQNALGRIAMALAASFNDQHKLGQDLSGRMGTNLFAAGTSQVLANGLNTGNASFGATITDYAALTTSDYRMKYVGTFSAATTSVSGAFTGIALGAGETYAMNITTSLGTVNLFTQTNGVVTAADIDQALSANTAALAAIGVVQTAGSAALGTLVLSNAAGNDITTTVANATGAGGFAAVNSSFGSGSNSTATRGTAGSPVHYDLTRLSDNTVTTLTGMPQTIDGVTLTLTSGAPAAGDSFLIQPTRIGASGMAVLISDINRIAAAAPIRSSASLNNSPGAAISSGSVNTPGPANGNLQNPVTITFTSGAAFNVSGSGSGNPAGVAYTAGGNISYNGWTVQISGSPAAGDVFTIGPNTGGVGDNRNVLSLAALQSKAMLVGGNASLQSAYAQLVSEVGNQAQEANVTGAAQNSLLASVEEARQSASAVNLDEEAANLMRYQQAYQASGKIIAMAGQLFDTILQLGR